MIDTETGDMHAIAGMLFVPFMTLEWLGNTKVMFSSPSIDIPATEKKLLEGRMGLYHFDVTSQKFRKVRVEEGLMYFVLSPDRKKILQILEMKDKKTDSQDVIFVADMVISDLHGRRAKRIGQCHALITPVWVGNDRIAFARVDDDSLVVLRLSDGKEKAISLLRILPLPER